MHACILHFSPNYPIQILQELILQVRYNEVAIRLPRFLNPLEDKIRKTILKTVSRGRIDVFITADYNVSGNCTLKVDKNLAAAYHKALQEVGVAIGADAAGINAAAEIAKL